MSDDTPSPGLMGNSPDDPGKTLMRLFTAELIRRLTEAPQGMVASELEVVRKFMGDNTITLANVRRGDFGEFAQRAAEEFPFDDEGNKVVPIKKQG